MGAPGREYAEVVDLPLSLLREHSVLSDSEERADSMPVQILSPLRGRDRRSEINAGI